MENFDNIKSIWISSNTKSANDFKGIEKSINQYNKKQKNKNLLVLILLCCMFVVLFYLIAFAHFKLWTTYFGISIFILITFYLTYLKIKKRNKITDAETLNNKDFLISLEQEKNKVCNTKSNRQTIFFIIYSVGFAFYIFEVASKTTTTLIIGYGALIIYIIAAKYFYLPLMSKRNKQNIQKVIDKINDLKTQFNKDEKNDEK